MAAGNLFTDIPARLADEQFVELLSSPHCRIERIVTRGQSSPPGFWYDQDRAEWVVVLAGAARLTIEGGAEHVLRAGDHLLIPAHCRHRVEWTDPEQATIWLAVHYG